MLSGVSQKKGENRRRRRLLTNDLKNFLKSTEIAAVIPVSRAAHTSAMSG